MLNSRRAFLRRLLIVLVLLLLCLTLWWTAFRAREIVDTSPIIRGDVEVDITALGVIQPSRYVDVGAQASGEIRRIAIKAGSVVRRGELLVEIDPAVQQAKVDADRATLDSLRAQMQESQAALELAQQQYTRQRRLTAAGATREEDVQTAQANQREAVAHVDDLRAQIAGASSTLEGDQAQLGYTRIYAPMGGTVVSLDAREGQTINATYSTPKLLRIADLSTMTVWTEVSEADIRHIHPGMQVYFTTLGDDRRWTGTVRQILPAPVNPSSDTLSSDTQKTSGNASSTGKVVLYTVLFDVDNADDALRPQMSAQVFFIQSAAQHTVLAPLAALKPGTEDVGESGRSDRYVALVQQPNGTIVSRTVRIGVHDRLFAQVLSGLSVGERIVTGVHEERPMAGRFTW